MAEPKLLTEADVKRLHGLSYEQWPEVLAELRERGLIAPEPVDPLLIEAREIAARVVSAGGAAWFGGEFRKGKCDDHRYMEIALAALRRGMELAPARTLTREMAAPAHDNEGE